MPKSNRLAGEDFQDFQKKKQAPSVVGCSVHAPAAGSDAKRSGNRIRPSLPRAHHLPRQSKPRRTWRVGGMHRCVVVAAGLVDDIKQRPKRGSKTASPAQKKPTPLRSRPPAQQLPSSAPGQKCKTGTHMEKGGVTYRILVTEEKKGGVDRVCCCCESRSVGRSRMAGRFRRTNERCGHPAVVLGGGGEGHSGTPRLGLAWAPK